MRWLTRSLARGIGKSNAGLPPARPRCPSALLGRPRPAHVRTGVAAALNNCVVFSYCVRRASSACRARPDVNLPPPLSRKSSEARITRSRMRPRLDLGRFPRRGCGCPTARVAQSQPVKGMKAIIDLARRHHPRRADDGARTSPPAHSHSCDGRTTALLLLTTASIWPAGD